MKGLRFWIAVSIVLSMCVPAPALAYVKEVAADGSYPSSWALGKPIDPAHSDVPPAAAGGSGTGSNTIGFGLFGDGDIIVTLGSLTGHAGMWDSAYWSGSVYDRCFWSANTTPYNGVQREAPAKYRAYPRAYGLWVPSLSYAKRTAARTWARSQNGEPYVVSSLKGDTAHWYCSKLVWCSYKHTSGIDLDANGGAFVWPVDLLNDPATKLFAYSD